ncbi:MAG: polysaccharide deacetylase family protein [Isosphaeraceae bacterium]
MRGRGLAVLTYHGFGERRSVLTTEPARFSDTLERLATHGFHPVDLVDWIERGCPDEPNGYAVTFDDGLASIGQVVDAIAAYHIPATIFVVAGRVARTSRWPGATSPIRVERLLGWPELADLVQLGCRIAAHGMTHRPLTTCNARELDVELRGTRQVIEDRLGQPCSLLAYPYGISDVAVRKSAAAHYRAAFGTGLGYSGSWQDRFNLDRLEAYYLNSPVALNRLVEDRWRSWLMRRRLLRAARSRLGHFGHPFLSARTSPAA